MVTLNIDRDDQSLKNLWNNGNIDEDRYINKVYIVEAYIFKYSQPEEARYLDVNLISCEKLSEFFILHFSSKTERTETISKAKPNMKKCNG